MPNRKALPYTTAKENRMYEDIKHSESRHQGRSLRAAKRIAAATVNKLRRRRGQTKRKKE